MAKRKRRKSQTHSAEAASATATPQAEKAELSKADKEVRAIQKKLGLLTFEQEATEWLDTGSPLLNAALGSPELGMAYGKLIELYGLESNGKSLLAALLAGLAQQDDAAVGWIDLENSLDELWAKGLGIDWDNLYKFRPKLVKRAKDKEYHLQYAEELMDEAEEWMRRMHEKGIRKLLLVVDSVTAILTEEEAVAGNNEQNMKTKLALASFMSRLLRRWCALCQIRGCAAIFINQIRLSPQPFGNPEVTPGGKALKFYCSVRVRVRRIKGGRLLQGGKMVGLRGVLANQKNKAGGGSREAAEAGFKVLFDENKWKFMSARKLKQESGEEE